MDASRLLVPPLPPASLHPTPPCPPAPSPALSPVPSPFLRPSTASRSLLLPATSLRFLKPVSLAGPWSHPRAPKGGSLGSGGQRQRVSGPGSDRWEKVGPAGKGAGISASVLGSGSSSGLRKDGARAPPSQHRGCVKYIPRPLPALSDSKAPGKGCVVFRGRSSWNVAGAGMKGRRMDR